MALKNYTFSHKKGFLKDPSNPHSRANFLGQVYEAAFIESLIGGQVNGLAEGALILKKPPYAKRKLLESGFKILDDGSLVYDSQGIPMGEFDALSYSEEEIIFYECFLSKNKSVAKKHKRDSKRKAKLLEKLFPQKKITCGIVSNDESLLTGFEDDKQFTPIVFNLGSIDLLDLAKSNTPGFIESTKTMLDIETLNSKTSVFNYLDLQKDLSRQLQSGLSIDEISKKIVDYGGLIKRVYWGAIENKVLNYNNNHAASERIVLLVDYTNIKSPIVRNFVYKKGCSEIFTTSKPDKKLNRYQPTLAELRAYRQSIRMRSLSDYVELLDQVESA